MNFSYSDSTTAEKLSLLSLLSLQAAFFLSIFFIDFEPSRDFLWLSIKASVPLTIAIVVGFWVVPPFRLPKRSVFKSLVGLVFFLPLIWVATVITFIQSVGYVSIQFSGRAEDVLAEVVEKKNRGFSRHGCTYLVTLQMRAGKDDRVSECAPRHVWHQLNAGDRVELSVYRSPLGVTVRNMRAL